MRTWLNRDVAWRVMVASALLILGLVALFLAQSRVSIESMAYEKDLERARALTTFTEQVRTFMATLNMEHAFRSEELLESFKNERAGGKAYSETTLYKTVPVVAAWTAAQEKSAELGFEFRVQKNSPRNPKNEPRPGVEAAVINFLEGKGTWESIEEQGASQRSISAIGDITRVIGEINSISSSIASSVEEQNTALGDIRGRVIDTAKSVAEASRNVTEAAGGANEVSSNVQRAVVGAAEISRSMDDLALGTNEISRNVAEAAQGVGHLAQSVVALRGGADANSRGARELGAASASLARMAMDLQALVSKFSV